MKRPSRRSSYLVAAGALSILLGLTGAWSQTARTVKIVVPYPAGGTADILARILGEQISRTEGATLLTENRPGASAVIGTEAVSRAAPDGSTLLLTSTAFLIAPHLRKLNYDPLTSFEPICQLVSAPIIVVVNSESPYRTLADWLNAAREKPGSLTLASIPAGLSRIAFEMLKRAGVHPLSGRCPCRQRAARRACERGVLALLRSCGAAQGGHVARTRERLAKQERITAERADRCRVRLQGL